MPNRSTLGCAAALLLLSLSAIAVGEPLVVEDSQGREVRFPQGPVSFADEVVEYRPTEPRPAARAAVAANALGAPDFRGSYTGTFVSLGVGGSLTLRFDDNVLLDGPGPDLYVFEVGTEVEAATVEISADGETWVEVGWVEGGVAGIDIGEHVQEGDRFRYVRLTDVADQGDLVPPYPGADIDAVGAIGAAERVELPAEVLFDIDRHVLKPGAYPVLDDVVGRIESRGTGATVQIDGHTDSTGSAEHNLELSTRRAQAVAEYLSAQGVPEGMIDIRGFGESRPTASNDTEEGRRRNRRVEILIGGG